MKKAFLLISAACLSGCATINRTCVYHDVKIENGQTPIESVEIENSGWLLFKCLPLGSGDLRQPNQNTFRGFTDTVTLQNNLAMLDYEIEATGATAIANLTSRKTEENYLFVVLTRHAYHTSAVLVKDANGNGKDRQP